MHKPRRAFLTALITMLGAGLALAGCSAPSSSASDRTLTIAALLDNSSFDIADLEIGNRTQYWMPVYDTLLVLDENSELQPNLATEWTYNAENTVLTLGLRDDVEFTDGEAFDASAVKANLEHLAKGNGPNAFMAQSIDQVEVVSPTEVRLHLKAPDPGLVYYLAVVGGAMASPAALGSPDLATRPIGSGPYVLDTKATRRGSEYTYTRNPDYWNPDAFPYDTIVIKPIPDPTARLNALKSGQVDSGPIEPTNVEEAQRSGLQVASSEVNWQGLVIADRNGKSVPALGDVRVRQAINLAFDAEAILKNLQGGYGEVTDQIFNTSSQAYVPDLDQAYGYDVDRARQLMAAAGYANGFAVTMPNVTTFAQVSPIIEQQLGAINIKVNWVNVSADAIVSEVLSGKFPMYFFSLGSQAAWQDMQKVALPASPWNTAKVEDPALLELIDRARGAAPGEPQDKAMQAVNEWLVENAWFAPWYRADSLIASRPDTEVTPQPWNAVPWIQNYQPAS